MENTCRSKDMKKLRTPFIIIFMILLILVAMHSGN